MDLMRERNSARKLIQKANNQRKRNISTTIHCTENKESKLLISRKNSIRGKITLLTYFCSDEPSGRFRLVDKVSPGASILSCSSPIGANVYTSPDPIDHSPNTYFLVEKKQAIENKTGSQWNH
uniref:Uncharacterized protein n=1 Tax=Megaselia scalaris TaxID=36166 RepID=T1H1U0_MEGSC